MSKRSERDETEENDENKRQLVHQNKSEQCLICHDEFSELAPPYPIGNNCVANPKHKYHSQCLLNYYNTIPIGHRSIRNACFGCGTMRDPDDRNYANNEITNDLYTDVQNRAAQEAQAQPGYPAAPQGYQAQQGYQAPQGYLAAQAALAAVGYEHLTQRQRAALFNYNPVIDAELADQEVAREAQVAALQLAASQAAAAQAAHDRDADIDEQVEECEGTGCNIMGGKFRKSRRKTNKKRKTKRRKNTKRKKTNKKRKTKRN